MYNLSAEDMDQLIVLELERLKCSYSRKQVGNDYFYRIFDNDKELGLIWALKFSDEGPRWGWKVGEDLTPEQATIFGDATSTIRKLLFDESEYRTYFSGKTSWQRGTQRPYKEPLEGTRELLIQTTEEDFWDGLVRFAEPYEEDGLLNINIRKWDVKPDPVTLEKMDGKGWHIEFARENNNKNPVKVTTKSGEPFTIYDYKYAALIWISDEGGGTLKLTIPPVAHFAHRFADEFVEYAKLRWPKPQSELEALSIKLAGHIGLLKSDPGQFWLNSIAGQWQPDIVHTASPEVAAEVQKTDVQATKQQSAIEENRHREDSTASEMPVAGRYGTDRDMSLEDVQAVVGACKLYTDRGGTVTEFHRRWEFGSGKFELETLRSWLKKPNFNPRRTK